MADPIKKNAQDYARRDANNESAEDNHTYSFGLFRQDFSRKREAVQEWHECGLGPVTSLGLALPFKPSRESRGPLRHGVLDRHASDGCANRRQPLGIPATHS